MEVVTIGVFAAFLVASAIIGIIVVTILFLMNQDESLTIRLLSFHLVCLILLLLANAGFESSFYLEFPYLFRAVGWSTFCITPLSYLYVRTSLTQAVKLERSDIILFLPAIAYLLTRIKFYSLPQEEMMEAIRSTLNNYRAILAEPDGMLPPGWIAMFRMIYSITLVTLQIRLLVKWYPVIMQRNQSDHPESGRNYERYKWLVLFTTIIASSYVIILIATILQLQTPVFYGYLIAFTISCTMMAISVTLFANPRLLYGMSGWHQLKTIENKSAELNTDKILVNPSSAQVPAEDSKDEILKTNVITEEWRSRIGTAINKYLNESTSFLNFKFTIRDLSDEIEIPVYLLSAFINQEYDKSFVEFINDARINQLLLLLEKDPKIKSYTLQHIGESLGFRSRTTFIAAVKKRTGKTPSELINFQSPVSVNSEVSINSSSTFLSQS